MDPLTIHGQKVLYVSTQENFHGFPLDLSNVLIDKCNGQSLTMHSAKNACQKARLFAPFTPKQSTFVETQRIVSRSKIP